MAMTEAQKRADAKYKAAYIRQIKMNFHKEHDSDILSWLDGLSNKQGYIKELIREDIKRSKSNAVKPTVLDNDYNQDVK